MSNAAQPYNRKQVSTEELILIKYQLELVGRPEILKAGLQRFCSHYEAGRYYSDLGAIRNSVRGLAYNPDAMVRRWAYKSIAYAGKNADVILLTDRFKSEPDKENLTWIMSALFSLSKTANLAEVCRTTGVIMNDAMALSSLLFGTDAVNKLGKNLPSINVENADELTLKWCALLAGYQKAPSNLFDPNHSNGTLLGALNNHDAPEVAEYSVWALWKSPAFSIVDLKIEQQNYINRPENVRRWTNRLVSKNPDYLSQNLDLFDELSSDDSRKAREGLALGIRDAFVPNLTPHVLKWYQNEDDQDLKEIILEYFAAFCSDDGDFQSLLIESYKNALDDGSLRRRLKASIPAMGGTLFQEFKRIDAQSFMGKHTESLFGNRFINLGGTQVTNFNVGGDLNAQNVAGGSIKSVKNEQIQKISKTDPELAGILSGILEFIDKRDEIGQKQKAEIISSVNAVAEKPDVDTKKKLGLLLNTAWKTVMATGVAMKIPDFIEKASEWV